MSKPKTPHHLVSMRMPQNLYDRLRKDSDDNFRDLAQQIRMIVTLYYKEK